MSCGPGTLNTVLVLIYFNPDKEHLKQSDASKKGLRIVLWQEGQPVIYTSGTLTEIEKWYCNIERELFAIVYALKWLKHFNYGYTVQVESAHKPMMSI